MLMRIRRNEGGFVLVVVLLSLVFLLMLVTGVMSYAIGSQSLSRRDQNWNAALAAAEAGIDDYLFRMNQDAAYYLYGDWTTGCTGFKCDTAPLAAPPDNNQAFRTWVQVPGAASGSWFRYDRDKTNYATNGTITVYSTGRVGKVTRTIKASLRKRSFLDYLYFTDFETKDPLIYTQPPDNFTSAEAQVECAMYYYAGRDGSCTNISFGNNDSINGPLHSNDAIRISGNPDFNGPTTTSWADPADKRWWGSGTPTFQTGDPRYADPLPTPTTNAALKSEGASAAAGGCLFTGPTAIRLNANGTMDVISPFTKYTTGTANQYCPVTYSPDNKLYYTSPGTNGFKVTNMTLPANGVIYVQNVPTTASDANYTNGCPFTSRPRFGNSASTVTNPLGLPQQYDITPTSTSTLIGGYGCRNGDAFVQGTLDGRLTIAADNNIVVFGDLTYEDPNDDLLGLVPNNYVEVYHPTRTDGTTTNCDGSYAGSGGATGCSLKRPSTSGGTPSLFSTTTVGDTNATMATTTASASTAFRNAVIKAAILSVAHSFRVQWYQYGDDGVLGTLNVTGAIGQKYRGIVGLLGTTGYVKNYVYDQRLRYDSPPKILNLIQTASQVVTWLEQPSTATGGYIWSAP